MYSVENKSSALGRSASAIKRVHGQTAETNLAAASTVCQNGHSGTRRR